MYMKCTTHLHMYGRICLKYMRPLIDSGPSSWPYVRFEFDMTDITTEICMLDVDPRPVRKGFLAYV